MTYDVDDEDLHLILGPDDIGAAIDCAIIIHDNAPKASLSVLDRSLVDRNKRLSQRLEKRLRNHIILTSDGEEEMNSCITRAWATFVPTESWISLSGKNERWVMTTMCRGEEDEPEIHYNLLDGRLLINGTLLKRLPEDFLEHNLYKRTFGSVS